MKRWRRPLILIALLLLAGAVVNVAVAWVCAARLAGSELRGIAGAPKWAGQPSEQDGVSSEAFPWAVRGIGWREYTARYDHPDHVHAPRTLRARELQLTMRTLIAGWPAPALRLAEARRKAGGRIASNWWRRGVLLDKRLAGTPYVRMHNFPPRLPVEPIVPGFLLNTLFYAAILALPLSIFPIRRRLRARRGRCPKCGYDLAGLAGAERGGEGAASCPECGATAPEAPVAWASSPRSAAGRSEGSTP